MSTVFYFHRNMSVKRVPEVKSVFFLFRSTSWYFIQVGGSAIPCGLGSKIQTVHCLWIVYKVGSSRVMYDLYYFFAILLNTAAINPVSVHQLCRKLNTEWFICGHNWRLSIQGQSGIYQVHGGKWNGIALSGIPASKKCNLLTV